MSYVRRRRAPKLEPELLQRPAGGTSVASSSQGVQHRERVSGAIVAEAVRAELDTPPTITLCDGSQFTFSRLIDIRTVADA